jgi:hypothetical protein
LLTAIAQTNQGLTTATEQLSSGRNVNQISDNPAAVATLVGNHNQASEDDKFLQNNATLQSRFQVRTPRSAVWSRSSPAHYPLGSKAPRAPFRLPTGKRSPLKFKARSLNYKAWGTPLSRTPTFFPEQP